MKLFYKKKMNEEMKILQLNQNEIEIINVINGKYIAKTIKLDHNIHGISLNKNKFLSFSGSSAILYEVNLLDLKIKELVEIEDLKSSVIALSNESVISAYGKNFEIYTQEGEKNSQIPIKYNYGDIFYFNVASKFLLVVTANNYFAVYDLERRGLKQILSFRKFEKNGQSLGEIREAAINCKGNAIIFLVDNMVNSEMRVPETKIIIYDVEMDSYVDYEISPNRIPIEIIWDFADSRIFAISTEYAKDFTNEEEKQIKNTITNSENEDEDNESNESSDWVGGEVFLLFYTSENGVNQLENHKITRENQGIFGLQAPEIYFISSKPDPITKCSISVKKMQFFQGLEKIDEEISKALIEFSLLMACGKLDEA